MRQFNNKYLFGLGDYLAKLGGGTESDTSDNFGVSGGGWDEGYGIGPGNIENEEPHLRKGWGLPKSPIAMSWSGPSYPLKGNPGNSPSSSAETNIYGDINVNSAASDPTKIAQVIPQVWQHASVGMNANTGPK